MKTNWKIIENKKDCQNVEAEFYEIIGNKKLAQILINRKIDSLEKLYDFFNPNEKFAFDYNVFADTEKVISRIDKAINNSENIIIYGDFDCDGVTSTALLYKTLKNIGANVDFYIPNRIEESHGLNTKALVKLLAKKKAKLIITCDCGISDIEEAKFIKSFNCDLIITDHHIAKKEIPNAFAILNPKVEGSLNENLSLNQIESLNELSGVGVAFKLALALINKYNLSNELINDLLVLVTIGTIGDVVPILNENRFFVKTGLNIITSANKGIQKLIDVHPYKSSIKNITSDFVAFQIVPKINAEGRLDSINQAFKLLVSQDEDEINYAIMTLTTLNEERQTFCNDMFIEAKKMIAHEHLEKNDAIILYNPSWHPGIVGIVASKIIEEYNRPCLLFTYDQTKNLYRASGRSVDEVDIHQLIESQSEFWEFYGGHKGACGCAFSPEKISFENIKANLNKVLNEMTKNLVYNKHICIDCCIDFEDLTVDFVAKLSQFEPFGEGMKPPLFLIKNAVLREKRIIGANGNHLKCMISSKNNPDILYECLLWNKNDIEADINSSIDIIFVPKISEFNGETKVQLEILDVDCTNKQYTLKELIKLVSGMIVYASKHKNGKIDLRVIAQKLSVNLKFVKIFLKILNDIKMIDIKNYNNNLIEYDFLGSKGMNVINNHDYFERLNEEYQKICEKRELEAVL